jgi:hypothetical protein
MNFFMCCLVGSMSNPSAKKADGPRLGSITHPALRLAVPSATPTEWRSTLPIGMATHAGGQCEARNGNVHKGHEPSATGVPRQPLAPATRGPISAASVAQAILSNAAGEGPEGDAFDRIHGALEVPGSEHRALRAGCRPEAIVLRFPQFALRRFRNQFRVASN